MPGGGAGGYPNGNPGADGEQGGDDASSTTGGAGGSTPFGAGGTTSLGAPNGAPGQGPGAGGGGASAPDRTSPLNWTGGDGADGFVRISWGPAFDPNYNPVSDNYNE